MNERREMPPIRYATYVHSPPERVYRALSTGPGWESWFAARASIEARAGGRYEFFWREFGAERTTLTLTGPVIEAEPGSSFAFRWGSGKSETTVRFLLEPRGAGTIVRITESGYSYEEADVISCLECACGWGEALTLLKFHLEHGVKYGKVPAGPRGET
jgi:uncharacterized protein YndB with AHSA1/START domain